MKRFHGIVLQSRYFEDNLEYPGYRFIDLNQAPDATAADGFDLKLANFSVSERAFVPSPIDYIPTQQSALRDCAKSRRQCPPSGIFKKAGQEKLPGRGGATRWCRLSEMLNEPTYRRLLAGAHSIHDDADRPRMALAYHRDA
jgi:hypothetical protein